MHYIKKNKGVIIFYLFVIAAIVIVCENNKKYDCKQLEPECSHILK